LAFAAIVAGGLATGVLAGLFGVGGGAIIVPVLYEVFRTFGVSDAIRMQLCVGTSLAIILPTSIRSFLAHRAKGDLPVEVLQLRAAPIIVGVAAGGGVAAVAPAVIFKLPSWSFPGCWRQNFCCPIAHGNWAPNYPVARP
jgi:uncharacterized protein